MSVDANVFRTKPVSAHNYKKMSCKVISAESMSVKIQNVYP